MLVLRREENQKIIIRTPHDEIVVKLVKAGGNFAKLGIEAPDHVSIHREEVQHQVDASMTTKVVKQ